MSRTYEWPDGTVRSTPPPAQHVKQDPVSNPSYEAMKDTNRKKAAEESKRDIAEFERQYCIGVCIPSRRGIRTGGVEVNNATRPTEVPQIQRAPQDQPVPVEFPVPVGTGNLFAKLIGKEK
jgi:hypothetical protein